MASSRWLALISLTAAALACVEPPDDLGPLGHHQTATQTFAFSPQRKLDLLLVVDNSASMAPAQARVAQNFAAFVELLADEDVNADFRLAITTTELAGPGCEAGLGSGALELSPCTERLGEFELDGLDLRGPGCEAGCDLDAQALTVQPTEAVPGGEARARPWLEFVDGSHNLPAGTDPRAALSCFGPQGIRGCEFESPLEAMYQALSRSFDLADPGYGFLRPEADLMILFVTDEADCSTSPAGATIFDPEGERALWSDPSAPAPTSALCWSAGVRCSGEDPSHYDACSPAKVDREGKVGVADADAVLYPVHRYTDLVEGILAQKRVIEPTARVFVSHVGGVGPSGELIYGQGTDPEFLADYGIGAGCEGPGLEPSGEPIRALPPVRIREFVDHFSPGSFYSLCEADYSVALEPIAERIRDGIRPACFRYSALDGDPTTAQTDAECALELHSAGEPDLALAECARDEAGYRIDPETSDYVMPSPDDAACYVLRTDGAGLSSDPGDDLSPECSDQGMNLEFSIARREPAPQDSYVSATCLVDGLVF